VSPLCLQLGAFADGELPDSEHQAFQDHLADCTDCVADLGDRWCLEDALAAMDRRARLRRVVLAGILLMLLALALLVAALVLEPVGAAHG
jgi:hypothetical protein